ncbi:metallophosphoesterase [Gemmata sp. G18]|uniref:Metallophosphoesterase n=1 Tax=Gemmata palustris TaxID=2822762 RepID=A0ABS5BTG6_9BACT|nr:metallophosphoesterase [Gemmata palustris]MBP3957018.1 metallophosphoesterase [Gemmata palustris]
MNRATTTRIGRRAFLANGALVLAAGLDPASCAGRLAAGAPKKGVRVGLVTDLHYADKPAAGTRYYRETLDKLAEAAERFKKDEPAFVVELGDLIDAADAVETELKYLKRVDKEFAALAKDRHYVLGNHCVDTLTKSEFLDAVGQKAAHGSFDRGGVHFVVLDACFRGDGKPYGRKNSKWNDANVPADQLDWLKEDLKGTDKPVVVFAHQRLDVANDYGVKNAADVRKVLEGSKKVRAVFQGHSHKNDYKDIGGVHYCTLVAMIEGSGAENNGYSVLDVGPDGAITVTGFRGQKNYDWKGAH